MLRKSLVALMMGVICAGSAIAGPPAPKQSSSPSTGLMGWLKNRTSKTSSAKPATKSSTGSATNKSGSLPAGAGIERAVVQDAERQSVQIRQASGQPQDGTDTLNPAESELQPIPIQQAPVLPNIQTVTGPQYFSATPAGMSNPAPVYPSNNWQAYQAPQQIQMTSGGQYYSQPDQYAPAGPAYTDYGQMNPQRSGGYPQTGAALYPAPVPGIPQQIGGIAIQNQAFHPHEMLHAHQYKAMYPPYYYKVNGGWMVTPFGVWSHEDWKLQGTTVDVKYKSHISPLKLFKPPVFR